MKKVILFILGIISIMLLVINFSILPDFLKAKNYEQIKGTITYCQFVKTERVSEDSKLTFIYDIELTYEYKDEQYTIKEERTFFTNKDHTGETLYVYINPENDKVISVNSTVSSESVVGLYILDGVLVFVAVCVIVFYFKFKDVM